MKLNELNINDFRNISKMKMCPCDYINIIYGSNAQGKTNIIEAIWLFSGNQSFRGAKQQELIMFEKEAAVLNIKFEDNKRVQEASLIFSNKKKIKLNGVELKTFSELNGNFYAVVFSPAHLSLIKEGPKNRRKFIDIAISQIKPQYKNYLNTYDKLLEQRNALLKCSNTYTDLKNDIDIWDIQIAKIGTIISIYRNDYIKKLHKAAIEIYNGISNSKEKFDLKYVSTVYSNIENVSVYEDEQVDIYYNKLKETYMNDVKQGSTSCGIHRDDIDIFIGGHSVKTYGSQGQQRSCVIALKLSEAKILKKVTGENPIMLLDDVMSELDEMRQDYILNHVKNMQVFITCCDVSNTVRLDNGRIFKIDKGEITEISQA